MASQRRIEKARGSVDHALDDISPNRHFAELMFDSSEAGDRPTELLTFGSVFCGFADRNGRATSSGDCKLEPTIV